MNRLLFFTLLLGVLTGSCYAQSVLSGKVISRSTGISLEGAKIHLKNSAATVKTNAKGIYSISIVKYPDTLIVSYVGYEQQQLTMYKDTRIPDFLLKESGMLLQEVIVNTGFYELSKERATGSFSHIDNTLLNRSVSSNLIDRLEGITNGLNFDRRKITKENQENIGPELRIHGISTIESNENPLIVLDNFPYESDLSTINPNDIENVTILRDAAASSIWGARAGNGVIVITTKQGKYNQKTHVSLNNSLNIISKPNLFYSQNRLPSATVMEIEKELFKRKEYMERAQTPIPAYVELLIKQRDKLISYDAFLEQEQQMKQTDIRKDASRYLYQEGLNQQYALNVNGGSANYRYYFSLGTDNNKDNIKGNNNTRLNLNLQNSFIPIKKLEISVGLWYTKQKVQNNGIYFSSLGYGGNPISAYASLADALGNPIPIVHSYRFDYQQKAEKSGLLDWMYRPLDEINLTDNTGKSSEIRLDGGIKYSFLKNFNLNTTYQFVENNTVRQNYYAKESYYVRNLVNRFTQTDGKKIVPHNGILEGGLPRENISHSARIQLNYLQQLSLNHKISTLAGADIRQQVVKTLPGFRMFDYDSEILTGSAALDYSTRYPTRPTSSAKLPGLGSTHTVYTDRYLSYFANASDIYKDRYIISASVRYDASNIFGVNTNQKGVPLWSAGGSWEISRESFYKNSILPYLRFRLTYGGSGNVNKSVSVYPIAAYGTDFSTNLFTATLRSAGNPNLRWEKVKNLNIGLDTRLKHDRLQIGVDYFIKYASDLIGIDIMDPTTGILEESGSEIVNRINYASLQTQGLDLQFASKNLVGVFKWETTAIFNYVVNKITHISTIKNINSSIYLGSNVPIIGRSRDLIYALPWNGLDHYTGQPIIYKDGQLSTNYQEYYINYKPEDLVQAGVTAPPYIGSIRNSFNFKGFQLEALITWKAGYVFKTPTMNSGAEWAQNSSLYHMDYFKRWQNPGDEHHTNVPARTEDFNTYRAVAYGLSMATISKGDHIRLQDINFSHNLSRNIINKLGLQNVRLYCYTKNIGIIWRADKNNLDPDYASASYPPQKNIGFGLQITL